MAIIGRKKEIKEFNELYNSRKATYFSDGNDWWSEKKCVVLQVEMYAMLERDS